MLLQQALSPSLGFCSRQAYKEPSLSKDCSIRPSAFKIKLFTKAYASYTVKTFPKRAGQLTSRPLESHTSSPNAKVFVINLWMSFIQTTLPAPSPSPLSALGYLDKENPVKSRPVSKYELSSSGHLPTPSGFQSKKY